MPALVLSASADVVVTADDAAATAAFHGRGLAVSQMSGRAPDVELEVVNTGAGGHLALLLGQQRGAVAEQVYTWVDDRY